MHQRDAVPFVVVGTEEKDVCSFLTLLSYPTSSSSTSPVGSTLQYIQNPSLSLLPSSFTWAAAVTSSHLLPPLPFGLFLTQLLERSFKTESQIMSLWQNLPVCLQSKSQSPSVTCKALGQPPVPLLHLSPPRPLHLCTGRSPSQTPPDPTSPPPSIVYPITPALITLFKTATHSSSLVRSLLITPYPSLFPPSPRVLITF